MDYSSVPPCGVIVNLRLDRGIIGEHTVKNVPFSDVHTQQYGACRKYTLENRPGKCCSSRANTSEMARVSILKFLDSERPRQYFYNGGR